MSHIPFRQNSNDKLAGKASPRNPLHMKRTSRTRQRLHNVPWNSNDQGMLENEAAEIIYANIYISTSIRHQSVKFHQLLRKRAERKTNFLRDKISRISNVP